MKISMLTVAGTLTVIVALAVLTSHRPSWGQPGGVIGETPQPVAEAHPGGFRRGPSATIMRLPSGHNDFLVNQVSSLAEQLRHAEGQSAQEKIIAELRELFAQYFDADLEARQKQVDDLKDRIAQLEAQIEKRKQAKDEIIDLQLEVIRNEAEGLGFYSALTPVGTGGNPFQQSITGATTIPSQRSATPPSEAVYNELQSGSTAP